MRRDPLVYADTATRLSDVAAVDPELAHMTRAQFVAFVSPVLAHRERVTTAAYGAADDALLGSFLDTLTLAYMALHPVVTDERGRPIYEIAALCSILYEWAERAGAEMYRMSGLERARAAPSARVVAAHPGGRAGYRGHGDRACGHPRLGRGRGRVPGRGAPSQGACRGA